MDAKKEKRAVSSRFSFFYLQNGNKRFVHHELQLLLTKLKLEQITVIRINEILKHWRAIARRYVFVKRMSNKHICVFFRI